jgi:methyl-accepting chemotaxis protein
MNIFKKIKDCFNSIQGRFSYRNRFVFMGILFFIGMPPCLYYVLDTITIFFQAKHLEVLGIQYQIEAESLFSSLIQYELLNTPWKDRETSNRKIKTLEKQIDDTLVRLIIFQKTIPKNSSYAFSEKMSNVVPFDPGIDQLWMEWESLLKYSSYNEGKSIGKIYETMILPLQELIQNNGNALNMYGNTDVFNYRMLYPVLNSFIPALVNIRGVVVSLSQLKTATSNEDPQGNLSIDLLALKNPILRDRAEILKEYSNIVFSAPEDDSLTSQLNINCIEYFDLVQSFVQEAEKNPPGDFQNSRSLALSCTEANQHIQQYILRVLKQRLLKQENYYNLMYWVNVFIFFIITMLIAAFVFLRVITRHFSHLLKHTRMLAQGKFTECFCSRDSDEFGTLGRAFDFTSSYLNAISSELNDLSGKLVNAITKIMKMAKEQEIKIFNQEKQIHEIEEIIQKVVLETHRLVEAIQGLDVPVLQEFIVDQASEKLEKIANLQNGPQSVVALLENMEEKMNAMGNLIAFMTKICENANLLSLNAAIETASVRKHKESFSAISQKIQRFASQTVNSTQDIKKILILMTANVSYLKSYSISSLKEINIDADIVINFRSQLPKITYQRQNLLEQFNNFHEVILSRASQIETIENLISQLHTTANTNRATTTNLHDILEELNVVANGLKNVLLDFRKDATGSEFEQNSPPQAAHSVQTPKLDDN